MKNLYNKIKENWTLIKDIGRCGVAPTILLAVLAYLPLSKLNSYYQTRPQNPIRTEQTFDEKVISAMGNRSNIMNFTKNGFYVDINQDNVPDAYVFPAPVRSGCREIIRLR